MSSLEGVRWDELSEGQKVNFDVGEGPKGPRAEKVRPAWGRDARSRRLGVCSWHRGRF